MKTIDKQPPEELPTLLSKHADEWMSEMKDVLAGDKGRSRKRKKRRRRRVAVYARKTRLTDGQTGYDMEIQEGEPADDAGAERGVSEIDLCRAVL